MKKNRFLITAVATFLFSASLCGCADVDGETQSVSEDNTTMQTTNSTVDSTHNSPDISSTGSEHQVTTSDQSFPTKCKIYKQTRKQFSEEQLLSFFRDTPQKGEYYSGNTIHYETAEETEFIDKGMFRYSTWAGGEYGSVCDISFFKENNIKGYEDAVLEFASRDEVIDKISAVLEEKLEIKRDNWFAKEFYAVKKENFDIYKQSVFEDANKPETSENELELDKLREWAEKLKKIPSEDYYYISLGFKLDNIAFYNGSGFYFGQDEYSIIPGYKAFVVYTKNGIESIYLINLTETDTSSGTDTDMISADEARKIVDKKYDDIIFDGKIEIRDTQLIYLPVPQNDLGSPLTNFELRPFYEVYCEKTENTEGGAVISQQITYIDAATGAIFGTS